MGGCLNKNKKKKEEIDPVAKSPSRRRLTVHQIEQLPQDIVKPTKKKPENKKQEPQNGPSEEPVEQNDAD